MLTEAGHQALFVGGCVRDALLGREVRDIDISTDARPETVVSLAGRAGLKPVPTGIEHGTITVVSGHIPHEITTFRKDVETDGRRAVVAFADRVEDDARRRDFTMNALYARPDGTVLDPLGGMPDLLARRLRFIKDPARRIREDYLRILRFFRFHAWYGDAAAGMDAEALAAIADLAEGIQTLSRERVGAEVIKLLRAPDPAPSVAAMRATGVLAVTLPGADDRMLAPLVHLEAQAGVAPDPIRRLAALGGADVQDALRLSRAESAELGRIRDAFAAMMPPAEAGYRLGAERAASTLLLQAALAGQELAEGALDTARAAAGQQFPVRAADLMPGYSGPALGARLAELENRWIASGFALTRDDLLG
ncbi:CCA tRNA nucleotidyltransferase [Pseudooceanicola sp. 216_PA32_1]|uniref:CCA tRNA nucleotidyltransferase n=1 Tax=Pseudooceanicola pacificus TaxID=2676438 RepID=A0A844W871_9RHOB|nr:CCA tRNA nucleotidyltransferase [Pseudooceanicola pacificus]MWB76963.1 CCA tRNA nucleotidyltransferase [Pseudooceanicola pacificus]